MKFSVKLSDALSGLVSSYSKFSGRKIDRHVDRWTHNLKRMSLLRDSAKIQLSLQTLQMCYIYLVLDDDKV